MKKSALICLCLFAASVVFAADREPWIAGTNYSKDSNKLSRTVDRLLAQAKSEPSEDKLIILIVPHAGYGSSGPVAGHAFHLLKNKSYQTVVLIGPSHQKFFKGASVWTDGNWKTPLGTVTVDAELAGKIRAADPSFSFTQERHLREHSLETEVPFLQKTLKNFKIVPIVLNDASADNARKLAQAIYKNIQGLNAVVIVSTDMSHHHAYEQASQMDHRALEVLEQNDLNVFLKAVKSREIEFCGKAAVATGLALSELYTNTRVEVLRYANSGDTTGKKEKVVGYGALAIYKKKEEPKSL